MDLRQPTNRRVFADWKKAELPIFRENGNEYGRLVIALRSTFHADVLLEKLLFRYACDRTFRERIDRHIRAKEDTGLARFIAVTVQRGTYIDLYTYQWRREILSEICFLSRFTEEAYDLITCSEDTPEELMNLIAPFL